MNKVAKILLLPIALGAASCSGSGLVSSESPFMGASGSEPKQESSTIETIGMDEINPAFYGPIAHRGYHDETNPENSINAFKAAGEKGFAIETDVHITSDDQLIISHDSMLKDYGYIETNTFDDIRANNLLEDGEELPSLEETFQATAETDTPILLELKTFPLDDENPVRLGKAVLKEARRCGISPKNLLFCSFTWEAILPILDSEYAAGLFISNGTNKELIDSVLGAEGEIEHAPDFVAASYDVVPKEQCKSYRAKGHKVLSWTLTSQQMLDAAKPLSDGYIFENFLPVLGE